MSDNSLELIRRCNDMQMEINKKRIVREHLRELRREKRLAEIENMPPFRRALALIAGDLADAPLTPALLIFASGMITGVALMILAR